MIENIKWLFFDVGSTLIDEHLAYEHRMREIAERAGVTFEKVYEIAMDFYVQNKKGDLEVAKLLGVELWSGMWMRIMVNHKNHRNSDSSRNQN